MRSNATEPVGGLRCLFPKLANPKKRFGIGVALVLATREGGAAAARVATVEAAFERPGQRPKAEILARADARSMATVLAGLAHPDRVRVASAIMTGSNTHRLLKETLGLKTGPLYHHIRALRLAGLVNLAARNSYALSELGETSLLVAAGLAWSDSDGHAWKRRAL